LTIAVADMPGRRPSSSIASRVMTATSRIGSFTTSSTWAIRPSTFTSVTVPWNRLRALMCSSPPRSRSISAAATTRLFDASRSTAIFPARSQRRSVSRLIPRAAAASAAA
jgi:hypothetical protein